MTATVQPTDTDQFSAQWQEWHTQHEARLADQHGFLAVTSINWLSDTPERFVDAAGEWWTDAAGVHVRLAADEELVIDGVPVSGDYHFGVIAERASLVARWQTGTKDVAIEVAKRGGYDIIRPRHPDAALLAQYHGTPAYTPKSEWAVVGRYVPFDAPRTTQVGGALDRITHFYDAPGRVEFELAGQPLALTVFTNEHGPGYYALFTDATSGVTIYVANRSLQLSAPNADGTLLIDFNRATNLPCAYTDLATCPLPPTENRLAVAIEAGEQIPYERRLDA